LKAQKVKKYQFFGTKKLVPFSFKTKIFFKEGGAFIFWMPRGGVQTKNMGKKENRHFLSWRGEKIGPLARIYTPA
jgi:hypothetical protein